MCASYGLSGDGTPIPLPGEDEPISEPGSLALLNDWFAQHNGHAKITGRHAKNLNPVLVGDHLALGWWSLWADGSGPRGRNSFNARDDSLMRHWSRAFQHRALLPATWYDEGKPRWSLADGSVFWIAAVTSTVTDDETGETRLSYAMVTRRGVGKASAVKSKSSGGTESRMPLPIPADFAAEWLDPERPGDARLVSETQIASEDLARAMEPHYPTDGTATLF